MKVLVTGGAGFIGHHFVEHLIKNTGWKIIVMDRLNYASSGFARLRDIDVYDNKRIMILTHDFSNSISGGLAKEIGNVDYIFHIGAETHVDNSIKNPEPFVVSNVIGTMHILNFARTCTNLKRMLYFSTDEIFGPAPIGVKYKEWDRYYSGNPYAASKAGGEELCLAYHNTYGVPVVITHTMNVFGERQHPEKFIPKTCNYILKGKTLPIHANKEKTKAGSRFWIHARNVAEAILFLINHPDLKNGDKYNIIGEKEVDNLEMAKFIANILKKELKYELVDFHSSRPGHDLRYALDGTKMKNMGWNIKVSFEDSLTKTILWSISNEHISWLTDKNKY